MASPLQMKAKWPSQKKFLSDASVSDFVPYVSNLVNSFRKVPRPMAPAYVDPVNATRVSMDAARAQIGNDSRAADLSTAGLDAQTAAAARVGTLATKFRALNDVNSREAMINAQLRLQTGQINAGINAQNTAITNQYRDDVVNSQIAQQREQSENLSNAADKYIMQQAYKDQADLDREKTIIMSKAYNQGVYDRLGTRLEQNGIQIPGTSPEDPFKKYRNMAKNKFAAGGMLSVLGDPEKPSLTRPIRQFKGAAGVAGTGAFEDNMYAMDHNTNRTVHAIDLVHSAVASGILPNKTGSDQSFRNTLDPKMYNYLYVFNQRSDLKGMNPEQRLQAFYNVYSSDKDVQSMKDQMKSYNPAHIRQTQTMPDAQPQYGNGGSIHIKPENRGKFTAYKKRTGKTTEEALHSKDPHVRQMANFARNAKKWKHTSGGTMIKPFL